MHVDDKIFKFEQILNLLIFKVNEIRKFIKFFILDELDQINLEHIFFIQSELSFPQSIDHV